MKINIWSDVRCPFCFVGKKKFEKALEWIGYGFIAVVSVLVLSTAFTLLWQFGKSIYKVLSK